MFALLSYVILHRCRYNLKHSERIFKYQNMSPRFNLWIWIEFGNEKSPEPVSRSILFSGIRLMKMYFRRAINPFKWRVFEMACWEVNDRFAGCRHERAIGTLEVEENCFSDIVSYIPLSSWEMSPGKLYSTGRALSRRVTFASHGAYIPTTARRLECEPEFSRKMNCLRIFYATILISLFIRAILNCMRCIKRFKYFRKPGEGPRHEKIDRNRTQCVLFLCFLSWRVRCFPCGENCVLKIN